MKKVIKKLLKESEFEWADNVDPLDSLGKYFYENEMSHFIKRDFDWWEDWCEEVMEIHLDLVDDLEDSIKYINKLIKADNTPKETEYLANEVSVIFSPLKEFGGKNRYDYMTKIIKQTYDYFGDFARQNNLNILDTVNYFQHWLQRERSTKKSLHEKIN